MQKQAQAKLISTEELAAILDDPKVKILDCSFPLRRPEGDHPALSYHKHHIKGARYLDLMTFKDHSTTLPMMIPNEKEFIDRMICMGVKLTDTVVCYETGSFQFYGHRAAWMLDTMGHPDVRVLNGGLEKWMKEGRPVESSIEADTALDSFAYKLNPDKIKLIGQVKAYAENDSERTY